MYYGPSEEVPQLGLRNISTKECKEKYGGARIIIEPKVPLLIVPLPQHHAYNPTSQLYLYLQLC